jgi:hypothetical protein
MRETKAIVTLIFICLGVCVVLVQWARRRASLGQRSLDEREAKCPNCDKKPVINGGFDNVGTTGRSASWFRPRDLEPSFMDNITYVRSDMASIGLAAQACTACGIVWAQADSNALKGLIASGRVAALRTKDGGKDPESPGPPVSCLRCKESQTVSGQIVTPVRYGWTWEIYFCPASLKWWSFTPWGAGPKVATESTVCLGCGFLRTSVDPQALNEFVAQHCRQK